MNEIMGTLSKLMDLPTGNKLPGRLREETGGEKHWHTALVVTSSINAVSEFRNPFY